MKVGNYQQQKAGFSREKEPSLSIHFSVGQPINKKNAFSTGYPIVSHQSKLLNEF